MARPPARRKPQYGVGRNGKAMSPAQLRALKKAQLASARKRKGTGRGPTRGARKGVVRASLGFPGKRKKGRNNRINKKIARVQKRGDKRIAKQKRVFQSNLYTHSVHGGTYTTARGVHAYNKAFAINNKTTAKVSKLKAKRR